MPGRRRRCGCNGRPFFAATAPAGGPRTGRLALGAGHRPDSECRSTHLRTGPYRDGCARFGNEGTGLSAALREVSTELATIPMPGHTESLNVAAAAAICPVRACAAGRRCPRSGLGDRAGLDAEEGAGGTPTDERGEERNDTDQTPPLGVAFDKEQRAQERQSNNDSTARSIPPTFAFMFASTDESSKMWGSDLSLLGGVCNPDHRPIKLRLRPGAAGCSGLSR